MNVSYLLEAQLFGGSGSGQSKTTRQRKHADGEFTLVCNAKQLPQRIFINPDKLDTSFLV